MKFYCTPLCKIALGLVLLFSAAFSLQAQITISAGNMPVPDSLLVDSVATLLGIVPEIGDNLTYDYRDDTSYFDVTLNGATPFLDIPAFDYLQGLIDAGSDKAAPDLVAFGNGLTYTNFGFLDFNEDGVFQVGHSCNLQSYPLGAFTGSASDSIYFPLQAYVSPTPLTYFEYPFTVGDSWTDTSRLQTDFVLDAPAFGLNNTPAQHVFYSSRTVAITGYGTMRVYTPEGPSEAYDVLVKTEYRQQIDSFYLGGNPAPDALLTAFGIAQSQTSSETNIIDFVAADIYPYLLRFLYQDRPEGDYSNPTNVFLQNNFALTSAIFEVAGAQYSTIVYPNPSSGGQINVKLIGADFPTLNYELTDVSGRVVRSGQTGITSNGQLSINFPIPLPTGQYYLSLRTPQGSLVATESIAVQ